MQLEFNDLMANTRNDQEACRVAKTQMEGAMAKHQSAMPELEWLWTQVVNFVSQGQAGRMVLVTIEPEYTNSTWEVLVHAEGQLVPQWTKKVLTSASFNVLGYNNSKFAIKWHASQNPMKKIVSKGKRKRARYTRGMLVAAEFMSDVGWQKAALITLLSTCVKCEIEVPALPRVPFSGRTQGSEQ